MYPVLVEVFGISISSYGVSKALAVLAAAFLLTREFRRLGWDPDPAATIVVATAVLGFLGAKLYYLAEHADSFSVHHLGGAGFTWYGGMLAGLPTYVLLARRHHLPLATTAAVTAAPLSVAYGIGRLGCFFAGDGSYGPPSDLPWAVAFPNGMVPTTVPVHPTALYEAFVAFAIAAVLWRVRTRWHPYATVGAYALLTGVARFLAEFVRINDDALFGLTQPQLWSLLLALFGVAALVAAARQPRSDPSSNHLTDRSVEHHSNDTTSTVTVGRPSPPDVGGR